jgi:uncharacterized protein (DUF2126 family)
MTLQDKSAFIRAIKEHDAAIAESGLAIWLGAEPTFTDRSSEAPEWLYRAEGGEKSQRALAMLKSLCHGLASPLILRTIGRQYPGEELPRWSFGVYASRKHSAIWPGPPDPALDGLASTRQALEEFRVNLTRHFLLRGWKSFSFQIDGQNDWRIVFRVDGSKPPTFEADERLARPSIHSAPIPDVGLSDSLSADGNYLIQFTCPNAGDAIPCLELPSFASVPIFVQCMNAIGTAASDSGLGGLLLQGFPPPVDASVAWATLTPDPAVVEVNMAPAPDVQAFYASVCSIYQSAEFEGLSPHRFYYNGDATDSGGGGQITFGGPSAKHSPFFLRPWLLPNVVRYCNRHPALS